LSLKRLGGSISEWQAANTIQLSALLIGQSRNAASHSLISFRAKQSCKALNIRSHDEQFEIIHGTASP
jgi:hypothetical protein